MELVINITKWPENSPLEHIGTEILIKDENDVLMFPKETITTNVWVKEIDMPVGVTYYVTERKIFKLKNVPLNEQELTFDSVVHTITNNDTEISNMLLSENVVIEKPMVLLKLMDIETAGETITINSSKFRGKGDGHTHTHWMIKADNEIKFKSIKDTINKTNITINKDLIKDFNNNLEIYCIHCSNFIESEIGNYILTKDSLNFKVTSNLINIPINDYNLTISKIDSTKIMNLKNVYIKQGDNTVLSFDISSDNTNVNLTIPKRLIEPNSTLIIEAYGYDSNNKLDKKIYKLVPYNLGYEDNINKDYIYKKTFTNSIYNTVAPTGLVTDTLNGEFIIPVSNGFRSRKLDATNGIVNVNTIPGLNHLGVITDMLIRVNNDGTILIDCLDNQNRPTFLVYRYNALNNINSYVLENILTRTDETKTTALNNSIEQISNDEFIYNVTGTNKLKLYNKATNKTKELKSYEDTKATSVTILKMDDNQLLCIGNGELKNKIYLVKENKYIDGIIMEQNGYYLNKIKKIDLVNGDKLLIPNITGVNNNKVAYFDITEYKFTELNYVIPTTNNNIVIRDLNSVHIGSILEKDYVNYTQDRISLYSFL